VAGVGTSLCWPLPGFDELVDYAAGLL
jgi:hypothetical protein